MVDDRDRGFTLVEILVVVVLIALITGVLAAVFTVIVRTRPNATARADDARSLLGITTWFPGDVSSTPRQPDTPANRTEYWNLVSTTSSTCVGAPAGSSINLLRLRWEETSGGTRRYEASYRFVEDAGTWSVKRVACEIAPTIGTAEVLNLTSDLPPPSASPITVGLKTSTVGPDTFLIGAEMSITTVDGDTVRVDGVSDSLNQTLGTIPAGGSTTTAVAATTTSTTSTTSTTTTTLVPPSSTSSTTSTTSTTTSTTTTTVPCSVTGLVASPNPIENQPLNNGNNSSKAKLTAAVDVVVSGRAGDCTGLQLRYSLKDDPYPSAQEIAVLFGGSDTITFQSLDTERWDDGNHTLRLFDANRSVFLPVSTILVVT